MSEWISVKDGLPKPDSKYEWVECIVSILESHFPTSSYDICDAPYDRNYTTTAMFDSQQKLWHLQRVDTVLNAMMDIDDMPLNGMFVTHWMPLPAAPEEGE